MQTLPRGLPRGAESAGAPDPRRSLTARITRPGERQVNSSGPGRGAHRRRVNNEGVVLLIMAMGSPTFPLPETTWHKWCETYPIDSFYGYKNVQFDPLFGHQYSHIWIDFRGIQDSFMRAYSDDYFENSRKATLSNRAN